MLEILAYLNQKELSAISKTAKLFKQIAATDPLWENLVHKYLTVYTVKIEKGHFKEFLIKNSLFLDLNALYKKYLGTHIDTMFEDKGIYDQGKVKAVPYALIKLIFSLTGKGFELPLQIILNDTRVLKCLTQYITADIFELKEAEWILKALRSGNPFYLKMVLDCRGKIGKRIKLDLFKLIINNETNIPDIDPSREGLNQRVAALRKELEKAQQSLTQATNKEESYSPQLFNRKK